jgi:hypothetical protein
MKAFLVLLSVVLIVQAQTNTGCEETNRWCSTDYECASQALCFVCQLLSSDPLGGGRGGDDTAPTEPFPLTDVTDQFCGLACGTFSDGFNLQKTPEFPICPQYYCAAYRPSGLFSSSTTPNNITCLRNNYLDTPMDTNAWYTQLDTNNWPFVKPFTSLPECLYSGLTSPSWCNRFGVDAIFRTTWNVAQMAAF